jgi:hypothetical protein
MRDKHGAIIHMCGDLGDHCADCAWVGEILCDYPVGEGKTCDRILCRSHAKEIGEDLHYCKTHYEMWKEYIAKDYSLPPPPKGYMILIEKDQ